MRASQTWRGVGRRLCTAGAEMHDLQQTPAIMMFFKSGHLVFDPQMMMKKRRPRA